MKQEGEQQSKIHPTKCKNCKYI